MENDLYLTGRIYQEYLQIFKQKRKLYICKILLNYLYVLLKRPNVYLTITCYLYTLATA